MNWQAAGWTACVLVISECALPFVFQAIRWIYRKPRTDPPDASRDPLAHERIEVHDVISGVIQRLFLFLCLSHHIYHALTFFGALKVAAHMRDRQDPQHDDKTTDRLYAYYITGNLVTAGVAVCYWRFWVWVTGLAG